MATVPRIGTLVATRAPALTALGVAGGLTTGVWIVWAVRGGGFAAADWGPPACFLIALAAVVAIVDPRGPALDRPRIAMLGALGAFVAWNFLSMTWADVAGDAWTGSAKTLLYAVGFLLMALWARTGGEVALLLGVFAGGVALVGGFTLVSALRADNVGSFFQNGRLESPTGYVNSTAGLWMMALWPALHLAASRSVPLVGRALSLGAAGLLAQLALLGQSRAWLLVLPFAVALYVVLAGQRLRALAALILTAAAAAATLEPLLNVFDAYEQDLPIEPPLHDAALPIALACAALTLAGAVWAFLDRRVALPRRAHVALGIGVAVMAVGALAGAGVAAVRTVDDPGEWIEARWGSFRDTAEPSGESRFTGALGGNRYREWKVAVQEFRDHPVVGIGSDNYAVAYLQRRSDEFHEPRYPHSIELRLLSQLGLVGTVFFVLFLGIALALALGRRRRASAEEAGAVGACLMVFAYWILHGSGDWFWEVPALAGPALGFLGLAAASPVPLDGAARHGRPGFRRAGAVVLAVTALVSVAPLWLAESYATAGAAVWRTDRTIAYARLDRAASLNPLAADAPLLKGSIALRVRDLDVARDALLEATEREPKNWYAHLQLALLAGYERQFPKAAAEARVARMLNPLDPGVRMVQALVAARRRITPERVNRLYVVELRRRFGNLQTQRPRR